MAQLRLDIVTPERAAFSGVASEVVLPGELGQMGILPGHVRLMSLLRPGELVARTAEGDRRFAVAGGFVDISSTGVSVFVDACEGSNDIDVERARRALANAERAALEHKGADEAESQERGQAIERARARIAVAERATR